MGFSDNIGITSTAPGVLRVTMRGVIRFSDVELLRVQIDALVGNGLGMVTGVVVDLSAVQACDCRVLPVLHVARRRMIESCGWLVVRGLDPGSLTGFAAIGLADAIAVYRASRTLAEPVWPREPGCSGAASRFSGSEHRLLAFGVELATHPATAVGAVGALLTDWCARILGVHAAVILTTTGRTRGGAAVVSASDERARLAAVTGLGYRQGPVVECLLRGEPVSAPDLSVSTEQWPRYVPAVLRHDVRAVRALPLRVPPVPGAARATTVGALVLLSRTPGPMAPTDLEVTVSMADLAGVALGKNPALARKSVRSGPGSPDEQVEIQRAAGALAETEKLSLPEAHSRLADLAR
jgi:hypothetical protein